MIRDCGLTIDGQMMRQILKDHKKWKADSDAGNRADLSEANLSEANLSEANLSEANLSEANLSEADLSEANLRKTNLRKTDLRWADLRWADLRWANLRWANLSEANLSEANLSGANLSGANLSEADLSGADLRKTDLSGADLSGADLSGANLSEAKGIIYFGFDLRGYILVCWLKNNEKWFNAGSCRSFNFADALAHWGSSNYENQMRGKQYVTALNFLNKMADNLLSDEKRREWNNDD